MFGSVVALAAAATFACTGEITEPGADSIGGPGTGPNGVTCGQINPGPSPLRRLTRWEYDNTVRDLLGDTSAPARKFVPEAEQFGFDNNAAGATLNQLVIQQYEEAASSLVATAIQDLPGLLGCDPVNAGNDACARSFIKSFGRRAFRRPLTDEEAARYEAYYAQNAGLYGFQDAVGMIARAMLQAPAFLYRLEIGIADPKLPGALRLTPYETASRLSYLLWGSMPDEELLAAAERNELSTPVQIRAQAERMLDSENGARAIKNFYAQWAGIRELEQLERENAEFSPEVASLLKRETETFVDEVVRKGDGKWSTLLSAPYSYRNAALASYYRQSGPAGEALQKVALDPERHAGILSHGSVLATLAHTSQPSAVLRGKFVLEKLLCSPVPDPPNDVDTTLAPTDESGTARQKLEEKTKNEPCISCHGLLNPPGFAFEHFDETGRWRDLDHGLAIDSSGNLINSDVDGPFANHVELMKRLESSEQVRNCVVLHWFRYAYGRDRVDDDACSGGQLEAAFSESGGNIRELLLALTQTPAFLYRSPHSGGAP
jgi:hypothetical protein